MLAVGEVVEARFGGDDEWFPGKIDGVNDFLCYRLRRRRPRGLLLRRSSGPSFPRLSLTRLKHLETGADGGATVVSSPVPLAGAGASSGRGRA